jgi:hypothetical protein
VGSAALITFVLIPATNQVANEPTAAPDASSSPGALSGAPIDGIRCESEQVDTHYHAHLLLLQDGRQVALPAGIGISNAARCLYSLHTHQADGLIHIESRAPTAFTLGQFFDIWGHPLSSTQSGPLAVPAGQSLHVFVDGAPFSGDPRRIELRRHQVLVIEAGSEVRPPGYEFQAGF